jgi:hypothetical protein
LKPDDAAEVVAGAAEEVVEVVGTGAAVEVFCVEETGAEEEVAGRWEEAAWDEEGRTSVEVGMTAPFWMGNDAEAEVEAEAAAEDADDWTGSPVVAWPPSDWAFEVDAAVEVTAVLLATPVVIAAVVLAAQALFLEIFLIPLFFNPAWPETSLRTWSCWPFKAAARRLSGWKGL